ncbi:MAG: DUF1559 domain-containing protein [Candidatus Omnitrophica bacterium]|nr:DUF1559 domain-containing protein [Candidatus Omnitrophota bacterium]
MLLPALSKARERARQARCISNLKQIGLAFEMYTLDFDEYFPPYWASRPQTGVYWTTLLLPYIQRSKPNYYYNTPLSDFRIYECPSTQGTNPSYSAQYPHYGYNYTHIGGSARYFPSSNPNYYKPAKKSQIKKPDATIVCAETYCSGERYLKRGYYILYDQFTTSTGYGVLEARHLKSVNVLWADGHVTGVSLPQMKANNKYEYTTTDNPYCYYPFRYGTTPGNPENHFDRY